jgi:hypothetical protein
MPKNPFSNQRGLAPIIIAVVVVVVLAAAGGGYFLLSKNGGGAVPAIPGVSNLSLNPNCKFNDPDLCKFVNNWKVTKDYSVKSTMSDKSGAKTESSYEMSGEEKFHMMMSTNGKEVSNMIKLGDTTYTKDYSDNKWFKQKLEKLSEENETQFDFDFDEKEGKEVEDKTTYKSLGKESCGSRQCFKYQIISPEDGNSTQFIWFDDREYLMRKLRLESPDGVSESEFSYDKVNISEPSPIKEVAPGQPIMPGAGIMEGMNEEDKKLYEKYKNSTPNVQSEVEDSQSQAADSPEE